jgi:hypothetical protein
MPSVFRDENCWALFYGMPHIFEDKRSAAFQDVEGFIHLEVPVNGYASACRQLLSTHAEVLRPHYGIGLDENVAGIAKMNEMFTACSGEHVSSGRGGLSRHATRQQGLTDPKCGSPREERPTFYAGQDHCNLPIQDLETVASYRRWPRSGSRKIAKSKSKIA